MVKLFWTQIFLFINWNHRTFAWSISNWNWSDNVKHYIQHFSWDTLYFNLITDILKQVIESKFYATMNWFFFTWHLYSYEWKCRLSAAVVMYAYFWWWRSNPIAEEISNSILQLFSLTIDKINMEVSFWYT